MSALLMAGCAVPNPQVQQAANPEKPPEETGPLYVEGRGYEFTWEKTDAKLISAPAEIIGAAKKLCRADGFDVAFMKSIAFDSYKATGYFGCRGSGGG